MTTVSFGALALWTSVAALFGAVGPFLLATRTTHPARSLGMASALAAGAMLGVGYPLMSIGIGRGALAATLGALVGVAGGYVTHVLLGFGGDKTIKPGSTIAIGAMHSAPEGVAIGAAMAVDGKLGLFLLATLAVHNVWEAEVLGSKLLRDGVSSHTRAALAGILTNVPQVLLALAAFAVATGVPQCLPLLLGFGFGALTYLCFAELLPESYATTGRTSIAVVVSAAAGVVALLGGSVQ